MKIASWNVNSLKVRLPHVQQWSQEAGIDILALQETKTVDEQFPVAELEADGWQLAFAGQKTYNGVAIMAREPISEVVTDIPGLEDPQRRILAATVGDMRVINLYVVNGKAVGTDKYDYKLAWLQAVHDYVAEQMRQHDKVVVLGDFNIAPDDADVHDPEAWQDKILCSGPERAALQGLCELGLTDTFRLFDQAPGQFSWYDYRAAAFRRGLGLRIDLILASDRLRDACREAWIDLEPRRWERPSDHAPVVAQFEV